MTQFGRALAELQNEILCANTSQAKGRVERANRTLQDRLVKELRTAGITNMEDGNAFLSVFMERYNDRFAKPAARPENLHRALNAAPDRLAETFCLRNKRYVSSDLTRGLVGKYADTYELHDGCIQLRHNGVALPCTIFDPHQQRVTHAAITDNKHLSAVLAHTKAEQDKAAASAEVRPESARNGYR